MDVMKVNERPLLIIVNGPPASGKSTLAEQVAAQLRLPYLSKDAIKEELYDSLGFLGVIERRFFRKLGEASMRLRGLSSQSHVRMGGSGEARNGPGSPDGGGGRRSASLRRSSPTPVQE